MLTISAAQLLHERAASQESCEVSKLVDLALQINAKSLLARL